MHKLLSRQIKRASDQEKINIDQLLEMISLTYSEIDKARDIADRTHATLEKEIMTLNEKVIAEATEISELLNSIGQIIFTFNRDLSINPHFSSKAKDFFGFNTEGSHTLVEAFKLKPDQIESFQTWVNNLFQPSTLRRWHKIVQISPFRELRLEDSEKVTILELDYKPIIHNDKLSCIMVIGSDVTRSRRIAAELSRQKQLQLRHSEHVDAFFSNSQGTLQLFLKELSELNHRIVEGKSITSSNRSQAEIIGNIEALYCSVHTVKGSAGTYGFNYLAAICHRVENTIDKFLNKSEIDLFDKHFEELIDELHTIERFWNRLCQYNSSDEKIRINKRSYYQLINKVKEIENPEYHWLLEDLKELEAIEDIEFSRKYHRIFDNLKETHNLYVDSLQIDIPGRKIKRELAAALDPILVHLVKNALDHGIEEKQERQKQKKGPGKINITILDADQGYQISVKDNGRGIDEEQISKIALDKQIISKERYRSMSKEEKVELIFMPQLSTKKNVTITSGRGIGMYSVKTDIDKLGGSISVLSKINEGTEFKIFLPKLNALHS